MYNILIYIVKKTFIVIDIHVDFSVYYDHGKRRSATHGSRCAGLQNPGCLQGN